MDGRVAWLAVYCMAMVGLMAVMPAYGHPGHEIAVPAMIGINDTITVSHGPYGTEVFIPEQITVLDPYAELVSIRADLYSNHSGKLYLAGSTDSDGSVNLRLDSRLHHDRDMLVVNGHAFMLNRTEGGAAIVPRGDLENAEDVRQMRAMAGVLFDAAADPLGRYDAAYVPGHAHVPLPSPGTAALSFGAGLDKATWPDYAKFLSAIAAQGKSVQAHLAGLPPGVAAAFMGEYPWLGEAGQHGARGARGTGGNDPVYVWGYVMIDNVTSTVPMSGTRTCAYDGSGDSPVLLEKVGGGYACIGNGDDGYFWLNIVNVDPHDGGAIDLQLGIMLDKPDAVTFIDEDGDALIYVIDTFPPDYAERRPIMADVTVHSGFYGYYKDFLAVASAHSKFADAGVAVPHVYVEDGSFAPSYPAAYCYGGACSGAGDTIMNVRPGYEAAVLREYGHHVQNSAHPELYGSAPPCDAHRVGANATRECAWVEGWAWFTAAFALDRQDLTIPRHNVNLEDGTHSPEFGGRDRGFAFGGGDYSEGWVAAALWDVYDGANEPGDGVSGNASSIMGAFGDYPAQNILQWQISWDDRNLADIGGILEHNNITPDTEPPVVVPPPDKILEAAGPETALDEGDYGRANATDGVDPDPEISSNAPDSFPLGDTVITWTATDHWGNAANATQTVTVRDTEGPMVIIPDAIRLNATGVLTWSGFLEQHATVNDADPSPEIEFDPEFLEIGDNTVSWTATDSSNNTSDGTVSVTVELGEGSNALDTDWHYKMTHFWAISPTKGYGGQILLSSSDVDLGNMYFFKSFSKEDIRNSTIAVDLDVIRPERLDLTVSVHDGRLTASDFGGSGPASRGGGTLASFENDAVPDAIAPDWSRSQLDEVTLVITSEKRQMYGGVIVSSVTFSDHSKWIFTDYKVDQRHRQGTYVLDPPSEAALRVHPLPVHDTFSGLSQSTRTSYEDPVVGNGWTYWGYITDPTFGIDSTQGSPSPSAYVGGDEFGVTIGIGKTVDISGLADGQRLVVSYDYRATGRSTHSTLTQAQTFLYDADAERRIHSIWVMGGGTLDTGWESYRVDITDAASGVDNLRVVLGFHDGWAQFYGQKNWFDNVRIYAVNQTEPVETVNTYADSRSGRSDVGGSPARGLGVYNSTLGL